MVLVVGMIVIAYGCARPGTSRAPANASASGEAAHGGHQPTALVARTTLLGNLGDYHRPITTTNADAQKFFDEGLTLLYGFNHEEAFRSFARAAALDPAAPMPHWGMSLALGTNYNDTATPDRLQQAHTHLTHAQERAATGNDVERAFIDALATRYVATPADGNQPAREAAYAAAMGEVSKRFPDDLDAATLHAESMMNLRPWKLYTFAGAPEPGTEQIVATLERVMTRNPNHPGANHYHIHAVEASRTPDRAVSSAKRLETLVPGAGHLVHMPAHIWMRTGDYTAAVKANAVAATVDEKYVQATGATGMYPTMYYGHNLQFESAAAMMAGNFAAARAAGQKTAALVAPLADDVPMLQPFALQETLVLLRFSRYDDVLAQPAPPAGRDLQSALYHYARGAAFAARPGQVPEAIRETGLFEASATRVPKDLMYSTVNPAVLLLEVARHDLAARIADARTPGAAGAASVAAWRRAVAAEDKVGYGEPPDWLLPTREGLAAALMRSGSLAEAEDVYRADLERNRKNPRSLFGLWKVLEKQRKTAEAARVRAEFEAAWAGADVSLEASTRGGAAAVRRNE
jgi:tetratricopeptide (TPR) repeat protein